MPKDNFTSSSTAANEAGSINSADLLRSLTDLEKVLSHLNNTPGAIDRMAASIFDLRMPAKLYGMDIVESREMPRYTLPEEVMPGVPWPAGFRDEINRWSREFLGTTNIVPRGQAFVLGGSHVVMRSEDVVKISNLGA